jgi:hypothetical protein
MYCFPRHVFGGAEGVGSCFHVLRFLTSFRRYHGHSAPVLMFCAPKSIFGGTDGVGSRFHVLRYRARFRRCRGRWVPFSCFALPSTFSTVRKAPGPVFMFCVPVLIFGGTECVGSCFHVLRSRTRFRRYRGRQLPFSCCTLQDSFLAVSRVSSPVFMFCAPRLVFGGSCFEPPESFLVIPIASGPVFMFCAPGRIFGGTEGVGSHFHVLHSRHIFCGTEGIGYRFHVLRAQTRFWRYRGHWVPFSCFERP